MADGEGDEWERFIAGWCEEFGIGRVTGSGELYQMCSEQDLMGNCLGHGNERSQRIRLGKALAAKNQAWVSGVLIDRLQNNEHTKAGQYRLMAEIDIPF